MRRCGCYHGKIIFIKALHFSANVAYILPETKTLNIEAGLHARKFCGQSSIETPIIHILIELVQIGV